MNTITTSKITLEQVKAQFQAWRKERVGRERIPEHLWNLALELLNHYPITTVQKQLLLNLKQLKQRSAQLHPLSKQPFLEIKSSEIAAIAGQLPSASHKLNSLKPVAECRIAFERSDGSRLTISLPADANIIPAICANLLRA